MQKFPSQGLNLRHSRDGTGSFTHCATRELPQTSVDVVFMKQSVRCCCGDLHRGALGTGCGCPSMAGGRGKVEMRAGCWPFPLPVSRGETTVWAWGEGHGVQFRSADP